jgi:hypothetical protein
VGIDAIVHVVNPTAGEVARRRMRCGRIACGA